MCPCYGLAEGTLYVTGRAPRTGAEIAGFEPTALETKGRAIRADGKDARQLVSSGRTWLDQTVVIVDPATRRPLPDGEVGEIWTSGANVAAGFWNRPDDSAETFEATLDDGRGPYLRTGDLGFVLDGELFVTGRIKDLIIIRGRNFYPQDIERIMDRADPQVRPGCGTAFGVQVDGEERLVLVLEVEANGEPLDAERVAAAVRRAVATQHDLRAHAVVLLPRGEIPKTSSGKLQRARTKELYLAGQLPALATSVLPRRDA
jgi:acyl-CoA synthetase (AMP-forming)/AMP-acid ligase II